MSSRRPFPRKDRVAGTMRREIARMLREDFQDPRVGFVTVLEVDISDNLVEAKVFVSVFPEDRAEIALDCLNQAAGFFRSGLAKCMKLRFIPKIRFVYDDSLLKGLRMETLLEQVS